MSVYIDSVNANYGRMKMSHMMADTTEELMAMADRIGVQRLWIQHEGTEREHFDVCKSKREAAIKAGAIPVSGRKLVELIQSRRAKHSTVEVEG